VGVGVAVGENVAATGVEVAVGSDVGLAVDDRVGEPTGTGVAVKLAAKVCIGVKSVVTVAVASSPTSDGVSVARRVALGAGAVVRVGLATSVVGSVAVKGVRVGDGRTLGSTERVGVGVSVASRVARVEVTLAPMFLEYKDRPTINAAAQKTKATPASTINESVIPTKAPRPSPRKRHPPSANAAPALTKRTVFNLSTISVCARPALLECRRRCGATNNIRAIAARAQ